MKEEFLNRPVSDQVFLDNPFELLGTDMVIPDSFRVNSDDWASLTDAETVALAPVNPLRSLHKAELLEPLLEVGVESRGTFRGTARARADEHVFPVRREGGRCYLFHR